MRIPKNKILENQYTAGGEFIERGSSVPYTGYYYVIDGNQYYVGKKYSIKSIELIKSNNKRQNIQESNDVDVYKYFSKKINIQPILIKEISKEQYNSLISNPLYKVAKIKYINQIFNEQDIQTAEKEIKEIRLFLNFSF